MVQPTRMRGSKSEAGEGATFVVRLPIHMPASGNAVPPRSEALGRAATDDDALTQGSGIETRLLG